MATSSKSICDEVFKQLGFVHMGEKRNGVIFVIIMTDSFTEDTAKRVYHKLKSTFGKDSEDKGLNYATAFIAEDEHISYLKDIMTAAGNLQRYITRQLNGEKLIVYCLAPIGCDDDGRKYIVCDAVKKERCYVKKDIVEPIAKGLPQWDKYFLFDGYLSDDSSPIRTGVITSVDIESLDIPPDSTTKFLPEQSNTLVAYSPLTAIKQENQTLANIGTWTLQLCDNISKFVLPITSLLDKTWTEVTAATGGATHTILEPHYVDSMGTTFLHNVNVDEILKRLEALYGNGDGGGSPPPPPPPKNIELIMKCRPEQCHLEDAILEDLKDTHLDVWREKFGKRLKGRKTPNNTRIGMCNHPKHLINMFYDERSGGPYDITWGSVREALESPTSLKRNKDRREIVTSLLEYLNRDGVYYTYKK